MSLVNADLIAAASNGMSLSQEIPCAVLDGIDRVFDLSVSRQHKHIDIRLMLLDPAQHGSSVDARHAQVGDDTIKGRCGKAIDALLAAGRRVHVAPFLAERLLHDQTHIFLIVDDQRAHYLT